MGLATIDPHSQEVPKCGENRPNSKPLKTSKFTKKCMAIRTLWRNGQTFLCEVENVKIYKEMYGHPDAVEEWPNVSL